MAVLFSVGAWAAPTDCMAAVTLADLIASNTSGGCEHQDKIFSNWVWTSTTAASSILVDHEFTSTALGANDVHGWQFTDPGGFTAGFTLSYTVTVVTNCGPPTDNPNCGPETGTSTANQAIHATVDQENSGLTPNGTSIVDTETAGSLTLTGASTSTETAQLNYAPLLVVNTSSTYTPNGGQLQTFEQQFFEENTAVPEPATLAICGGALVLLGFFKKRRAA
jgi:hypothetical protein